MTRFTGSIPFVYIHLVVFGLWITLNLPWAPPDVRFDPQFTVLAMAVASWDLTRSPTARSS